MTFKCKQCGTEVGFRSEKEAYLNGWFLEGMPLRGGILPRGLTICYHCGSEPLPQSATVFTGENESL